MAETFAKRADHWLATTDEAYVCNRHSAARSLPTQVPELAGHGWISGDRRHADKAIGILCKIANELEALDHYKLNSILAVGNAAQLFTMGYDLTRPLLTAKQDSLLRPKSASWAMTSLPTPPPARPARRMPCGFSARKGTPATCPTGTA